jgi:hypothetical protein
MPFSHKPSAACRLGAWLLLALPLGCGGNQEVADPDQARQALVSVLDAWHDGRSLDEVTGGNLGTTVADPSWKAGFKLSRYEVAEATQTTGLDRMIPVELWLRDPKGKEVRQKVRYTVSLAPSRTVLRSPF